MTDQVRIFRIIEYTGTRHAVEDCLKRSVKGTKIVSKNLTIKVVTIGDFPDIIEETYDEVDLPEPLCDECLSIGRTGEHSWYCRKCGDELNKE